MPISRVIVLTVLSTLTACALLFASAAVVVRATAADRVVDTVTGAVSRHHGGMHRDARDPCARLTDEHVRTHTAELRSRVARELNLDSTQVASLDAVTMSLTTWLDELRPLCAAPLDTAVAKVSAAARFAEVTDVAMQQVASEFAQFYATLSATQQAQLDDWFAHRHDHAGGHS